MSDALRAKMSQSKNVSTMKRWFSANPEAFEVLSLWMEMRSNYETDWSLTRILKELRAEYKFPFDKVSAGNFGHRLRLDYPEQYTYQRRS